MGLLAILLATAAAFGFGAVWYMRLATPWMEASGVPRGSDGGPANGSNPVTYVISFICLLIVATMMRHVLIFADIGGFFEGLVAGLGVGLFFITPWIALNNAYAMRPMTLTAIDGGYATIGCGLMGLVLSFFV